jgi:hypothetical protein
MRKNNLKKQLLATEPHAAPKVEDFPREVRDAMEAMEHTRRGRMSRPIFEVPRWVYSFADD